MWALRVEGSKIIAHAALTDVLYTLEKRYYAALAVAKWLWVNAFIHQRL